MHAFIHTQPAHCTPRTASKKKIYSALHTHTPLLIIIRPTPARSVETGAYPIVIFLVGSSLRRVFLACFPITLEVLCQLVTQLEGAGYGALLGFNVYSLSKLRGCLGISSHKTA